MLRSLEELVKDIWAFFLNPHLEPERSSGSLLVLLQLLILDFLLMPPAFLLMYLTLGTESLKSHKMEDFFKEYPITLLFFLAVVLAPLLEELVFRLYLRPRPIYWYVSMILMGSLLVMAEIPWEAYLFLGILGAVALVLGTFLFIRKDAAAVFYNFWKVNFRYLFYFSALLFGLVHLNNYELPVWKLWLFAPVLVLPQLILGILLGYVRVKKGLISSIGLHFLHNLAIFIPILITEFYDKS